MLQPKQYLFLGNANYPPFIYQENGQAAGLVVDITRAVMDKGEIGGKFEAREWKQAQSDVRTGSADALVLINKNAERESYLDLSTA